MNAEEAVRYMQKKPGQKFCRNNCMDIGDYCYALENGMISDKYGECWNPKELSDKVWYPCDRNGNPLTKKEKRCGQCRFALKWKDGISCFCRHSSWGTNLEGTIRIGVVEVTDPSCGFFDEEENDDEEDVIPQIGKRCLFSGTHMYDRDEPDGRQYVEADILWIDDEFVVTRRNLGYRPTIDRIEDCFFKRLNVYEENK